MLELKTVPVGRIISEVESFSCIRFVVTVLNLMSFKKYKIAVNFSQNAVDTSQLRVCLTLPLATV